MSADRERECLHPLGWEIDLAERRTVERDEARAQVQRVERLANKAYEQYGSMAVVSVLDLRDALNGETS